MNKNGVVKVVGNTRVIATILTGLIIVMLIITGSAEALILKLQAIQNEVVKGESLEIVATIEQESDEVVQQITFVMDGFKDYECKFSPDGVILSGCQGIKIEVVPTACYQYGYDSSADCCKDGYSYNYGYSYGYGYDLNKGLLKYNITIDTSKFLVGEYKTRLIVKTENSKKVVEGDDIEITTEDPKLSKCSIRAENGDLEVNGVDFLGKNRINFFKSSNNAISGSGYLKSQDGRQRLNYKFKVINVKVNNENETVVEVHGTYRLGLGKNIEELSLITIDKIKNKLTLDGQNVSAEFDDVKIKQGCFPLQPKPKKNK